MRLTRSHARRHGRVPGPPAASWLPGPSERYAGKERMDTVTVDTLAEVLQEPNRPLLTQVLRVLGHGRCRAILADTLQREANGGMLTQDGTRRRTPGGVFFQLVRQQARSHERRRL